MTTKNFLIHGIYAIFISHVYVLILHLYRHASLIFQETRKIERGDETDMYKILKPNSNLKNTSQTGKKNGVM